MQADWLDPGWWPSGTRLLRVEDLVLNADLFLVGSDAIKPLRDAWVKYLEIPYPDCIPPNTALDHRWGSVQAYDISAVEIDVAINISERYHGAAKLLPRSKVLLVVKFYDEKRPYLVVDQEWYDDIVYSTCSLYAMVDTIGMRDYLREHGHLTEASVLAMTRALDAIAAEHEHVVLLSCADNVFIKSNWSAHESEYGSSYRPEEFLAIVEKVTRVFFDAIGLHCYAVVTQGVNSSVGRLLMHVSASGRHIAFGGLATPFAELQEIDHAVRGDLRTGALQGSSLYLSESLFLSLKFKRDGRRDELFTARHAFVSKAGGHELRHYRALDLPQLLSWLKSP